MAARNRSSACAAVIGLFLGLAWLFFCMRMYVKTFLTKSFGVDDYLLIIGVGFFTTYSIFAALGVHHGTGRVLEDIPLYDIPKALHFWFLCEPFYALTTLFIRLSIATFIIRICLKRVYKIIIYATMAMVTIFTIFYFFLVIFQCAPVDYFWNQYRGQKGKCINPAAVPNASIAHSVVSFVADWILGLLPIALIWNLQMNYRTKISLACILAIGLLAGITTMIRIPYIKILTITDNFLYVTTDVAIWSTVEAGLGIVAASAYTLRPLFRSFSFGSSRATPAYPSAKTSSGHKKNPSRPSGAAGLDSRLGIPLRQDPRSNAIVQSNVSITQGMQGARSPFGDSNEDVSQLRRGEEGDGGIQVHRTFEVRDGEEDPRSGWNMPWREAGDSKSDVSIV